MTSSQAPILRRLAALLIVGGGIGGLATLSHGDTPPTSLDRTVINTQANPSGPQAEALKAFVVGWIDVMESSDDPRRIEEARRNLIEPLRDPAATPIFRRAFGTIALPKLSQIIAEKDAQRAINAMQVARFIRTPESVEMLASHLPVDRESDPAKRLAAASVLGAALSDADLNQPQFDSVIRSVASAADGERDPLVILQELRSLSAIAKRTGAAGLNPAPAASVSAAREAQVKLLRSLIDSVANSTEADPRMATIHTSVIVVRNQLVDMPEPERKKLSPMLAPALLMVLETARKQWDSAQSNPRMKTMYSDAVTSSETLLRIIDKATRGSSSTGPDKVLGTAWDKGSQADFDAELARWKAAVGDKAYR
ncbi:MAG: hypothetical protein U0572_04980 [Phycisphaerales bacterium]